MSDEKTILIIDDEVDLAEMVGFQLKAKGFEVVIAHNGVEGLEQLKTVTPQLIILDMNMPKMGGIEFYKNICDFSAKPRYPVFVLTARANMERLFKDFDVAGFLAKPFDIGELTRKVEEIVAAGGDPAKIKDAALQDAAPPIMPQGNIKIDISLQDDRVLTDAIVDADKAPQTAEPAFEKEKKQLVKDPVSKPVFKKKILFLEDDPFAMSELRKIFLKYNFEIDGVATPDECLRQANLYTPDLIILKHFIGQINTETLAERIKGMPHFHNVPIIVYDHAWQKTGRVNPSGQKEAVFMLTAHGAEMLIKVRQILAG